MEDASAVPWKQHHVIWEKCALVVVSRWGSDARMAGVLVLTALAACINTGLVSCTVGAQTGL